MGGVRGKEEKKLGGGRDVRKSTRSSPSQIHKSWENPRIGDRYPGGTLVCVVGEMGLRSRAGQAPFKEDEGK